MPKEAGVVQFSDVDSDRSYQAATMQCCHCGQHWIVQPGSGRQRGFCMRCNKTTCGPNCPAGQECVPHEQYLENLEHGRDPTFRPAVGSVTKLWTPGDE